MGFFHCKVDPGEKKLTPKSFNRKLQKKIPRVLPTGKQTQSPGKMNKNGQILFKKNESSSTGRALHHLRAGQRSWRKAKNLLPAVGLQPHTLPQPPQGLLLERLSTNDSPKTLNSVC